MLLTSAELKQLTDYSRPSDQVKWLKDHGWPFEIGSKGFPGKSIRQQLDKLGTFVFNRT